jgi:hypothetical protein
VLAEIQVLPRPAGSRIRVDEGADDTPTMDELVAPHR